MTATAGRCSPTPCRVVATCPVRAPFDAVLRHERFAAEAPDVVVRLGRPASSKVLAQWVAASGATIVQVGGPGTIDPDHLVAAQLDVAVLGSLGEALRGVGERRGAAGGPPRPRRRPPPSTGSSARRRR